ncbi:MAG: response regulator [Spirochaetes bacterium]|jgi:two-component system chemotaxis response regulator CheY|nr:response regulator [Spirochaetota bacterium]
MKSRHDFPDINVKQPDGLKPGGKTYKVMVVEDREFQRKQLVQILESEKYTVIATATNGEEALKKYDELAKDLDLITTNLDMPKMDGYAFLYELTARSPKAKIIFISDDTTKVVIEDLLKMGAADFILKPIERVRVLKRIRLALTKDQTEPAPPQ